MSYQVLENNIPADHHHFPLLKTSCWSTSVFSTFEEAKFYAFCWSYPISIEEAKAWSEDTEMKLDVEYDFSTCEFPVLMKIIELKN